MDSIKLKVRIGLAVIMLTCVSTGIVIDRYLIPAKASEKPPDPKAELDEYYGKNLNMSQEQITAMNAILDDTLNQYKRLKEEIRPRQTEIRNNARQKIRETLTPEQQPKFDELVAQRDAQREAAKQQKNK
jgi:hypothetical protein